MIWHVHHLTDVFKILTILNTLKAKSSVSSGLHSYASEYKNDVFSSDGEVVFCNVCDVKASVLK